MEKLTKTITVAEIRNANIKKSSTLSKYFQWVNNKECYFLRIDGEVKYCFNSDNALTKSINKIKKLGLGLGWIQPSNTDEENGLIQAGLNGEDPFRFSIICK